MSSRCVDSLCVMRPVGMRGYAFCQNDADCVMAPCRPYSGSEDSAFPYSGSGRFGISLFWF